MRFLLMLALVVSASLAIADELSSDPPRASELQGPIQASPFATEYPDATPTEPREAKSPDRYGAPESPATTPDVAGDAPAGTTSDWYNAPAVKDKLKVCVFIEKNSFTIQFNTSAPLKSRGGESLSTYIICNKVTATSGDTDPSTVNCTNCKVMLPDGNRGTANEASYDSITDTLTLRGTKDKPVKLTMGSGQRTMTAAEIAIQLNTAAPAEAPPIIPGPQPASRIEDDLFGSPFAPQPAAQDDNPFSSF